MKSFSFIHNAHVALWNINVIMFLFPGFCVSNKDTMKEVCAHLKAEAILFTLVRGNYVNNILVVCRSTTLDLCCCQNKNVTSQYFWYDTDCRILPCMFPRFCISCKIRTWSYQKKDLLVRPLKSECPRKSKSGKLQKIDFLLTKHIEGYWYGILICFNGLSQKGIYFLKFARFWFYGTFTLKIYFMFYIQNLC